MSRTHISIVTVLEGQVFETVKEKEKKRQKDYRNPVRINTSSIGDGAVHSFHNNDADSW